MAATLPDPLLQIDGKAFPSAEGWWFPTYDPSTGEAIAHVPDASPADVAAAVTAAHDTFHGTIWSEDADLREMTLRRLQARLVEQRSALRELMTVEAGVPARLAGRHHDDPIAGLFRKPTTTKPGVVAVLTPVTSPLAVALGEIGRVLAAGGTVVLKPAPEVSWTALELGRLASEVVPEGVLNVVSTRDVDVAAALLTHPRVDEVSFTGSAVNAARVADTAHRAGKRVHVDAGGIAPRVVGYDEELPAVVAQVATRMCEHAGQGCRLPATLVVPAHRYQEAVEVAARTMSEVVVGDPSDLATVCGPVVSPVQKDRVRRYLALAEAEGGRIETGGRVLDVGRGWWVAPTVVSGLRATSRVAQEEILGPVLVVVPDRG